MNPADACPETTNSTGVFVSMFPGQCYITDMQSLLPGTVRDV